MLFTFQKVEKNEKKLIYNHIEKPVFTGEQLILKPAYNLFADFLPPSGANYPQIVKL